MNGRGPQHEASRPPRNANVIAPTYEYTIETSSVRAGQLSEFRSAFDWKCHAPHARTRRPSLIVWGHLHRDRLKKARKDALGHFFFAHENASLPRIHAQNDAFGHPIYEVLPSTFLRLRCTWWCVVNDLRLRCTCTCWCAVNAVYVWCVIRNERPGGAKRMDVIIGGPGIPELVVTASVCTPVRCRGVEL